MIMQHRTQTVNIPKEHPSLTSVLRSHTPLRARAAYKIQRIIPATGIEPVPQSQMALRSTLSYVGGWLAILPGSDGHLCARRKKSGLVSFWLLRNCFFFFVPFVSKTQKHAPRYFYSCVITLLIQALRLVDSSGEFWLSLSNLPRREQVALYPKIA